MTPQSVPQLRPRDVSPQELAEQCAEHRALEKDRLDVVEAVSLEVVPHFLEFGKPRHLPLMCRPMLLKRFGQSRLQILQYGEAFHDQGRNPILLCGFSLKVSKLLDLLLGRFALAVGVLPESCWNSSSIA